MDMLKSFFPFSFKVKEKDVASLIISIVIYLVAGAVRHLAAGMQRRSKG